MIRTFFIALLSLLSFFTLELSSLHTYPYRTQRQLELSASDITAFKIEAGAGKLHVVCKDGDKKIQVNATIRLNTAPSSPEELDEIIELTLERKGEKGILRSKFRHKQSIPFTTKKRKGLIDLDITMPASLSLTIMDGSGAIKLTSCQKGVDVTDGSGDMTLSHIKGDVRINDGSGEINISKIKGELHINDGSGDITIIDAKGALTIQDGSGDITLTDIHGPIRLNDGSGALRIQKITGNIDVTDGSGLISMTNVKGDVKVRDGSGDCKLTNIKGQVEITDGSGDIIISSVTRDVILHSTGSGGVKLEHIRGRIINTSH